MAELQVRVVPRAKRNAVELDGDGGVKARVTAVPDRGKANAAVIAMIAKALDIPKRNIEVVRGHTSRDKTIAIDGVSRDEALRRLAG